VVGLSLGGMTNEEGGEGGGGSTSGGRGGAYGTNEELGAGVVEGRGRHIEEACDGGGALRCLRRELMRSIYGSLWRGALFLGDALGHPLEIA
jgi:hypothetical protein